MMYLGAGHQHKINREAIENLPSLILLKNNFKMDWIRISYKTYRGGGLRLHKPCLSTRVIKASS